MPGPCLACLRVAIKMFRALRRRRVEQIPRRQIVLIHQHASRLDGSQSLRAIGFCDLVVESRLLTKQRLVLGRHVGAPIGTALSLPRTALSASPEMTKPAQGRHAHGEKPSRATMGAPTQPFRERQADGEAFVRRLTHACEGHVQLRPHLLRLWFTSSPDRAYDYPRVPEHIWTGLKAARSAGEYYNLHIRDQYGEPRAPANPWRRR